MDWKGLFDWYDRDGIAYPWGEDRSPYRVWISEVMLQQTVVTAVIPFFRRWMERFPTLEELARTEEGEVLRYWEGLGYYSRARNILKASKQLKEESEGRFPDDYDLLTALPGIGDYTAGAILSISFGQNRPVIDANVKRICQRQGSQREWSRETERYWRSELQTIIERTDDPGRFNGALMQLGQLVCRIGSPLCLLCPLAESCRALKEGTVGLIPLKKKRVVTELDSHVLIYEIREGERTLWWIIQRREGIGKGLWTFPRLDGDIPLPAGWREKNQLRVRTHNYTKFKERLKPVLLVPVEGKGMEQLPASALREGEGFWAAAGELAHLAAPAVYRKIIDELVALPE